MVFGFHSRLVASLKIFGVVRFHFGAQASDFMPAIPEATGCFGFVANYYADVGLGFEKVAIGFGMVTRGFSNMMRCFVMVVLGSVVIDFIGEVSPCFAEMVNGFSFMAVPFVREVNGLDQVAVHFG